MSQTDEPKQYTPEVVSHETGEITTYQGGGQGLRPVLLFGTDDPKEIITKAKNIANALVPVVDRANLFNIIQGRKYVLAEGWTTMAAMLGVFPQTEYCKRLDRENEITYQARLVLKHVSGLVVGAGDAICSTKEASKAKFDEYAIASMAQTRAVGKACRLSFSWIMALAGYEATPAEEMEFASAWQDSPPKKPDSATKSPPPEQSSEDNRLWNDLLGMAMAMNEDDPTKAQNYVLSKTEFQGKDGSTIRATMQDLKAKPKWLRAAYGKIKADYESWMRNEKQS